MLIRLVQVCFLADFHTDIKDLKDCYAASGYAENALQKRALYGTVCVIGEADIFKIFYIRVK